MTLPSSFFVEKTIFELEDNSLLLCLLSLSLGLGETGPLVIVLLVISVGLDSIDVIDFSLTSLLSAT